MVGKPLRLGLLSLCDSTFRLLQKLVNDFLFPASRQVKEARDHPGGLNWFVYITVLVKLTNSMNGMPFVSDWDKSDTSMVYEEM